jgi:prepilin-type N-terminal cleavage/methylation domain-containing protein
MNHTVARRFEPGPGRPRQDGFTLFELVAVLGIFSLLIAFAADRAFDNMEMAEKAAMETQFLMIKSGMDLQIAGLISAGRGAEIGALTRRNPVEWLKAGPAGYLGAFAGEPTGMDLAGRWYFDTRTRELVYLANRHAHLRADGSGRFRVRYQVSNGAAVSGAMGGSADWPSIGPVEPYTWF